MPEIVEIEIRHPGEPEIAVIEVGFRGPAGRNGVGGADISATEGNALQLLPDGLFVAPGGTAELPTGQPGPAKAYLALERAAGRVLTFDALTQAMAFDPTIPPSRSNLANAIARLRPALPPGETIVTVHGIGYRLERRR